MTRKEFINSVAKRKTDIIQTLLDILAETGSRYCLIWDLAVNAYVEPVVSLDLDIVVTVQDVEATFSTVSYGRYNITQGGVVSLIQTKGGQNSSCWNDSDYSPSRSADERKAALRSAPCLRSMVLRSIPLLRSWPERLSGM